MGKVNTLSETNICNLHPKARRRSIEEHSRHFYMGVPPGPQKRVDAEELGREVIAQGYDRVNLCGEHKERMGKRGRGGGGYRTD